LPERQTLQRAPPRPQTTIMDLVITGMPDMQDTPSDSSLELLRNECLSLTPNDLPRVSTPQDQVTKIDAREMIRRGRKGRTKSRTGCLNCKRARIKVCLP
jgi:hypothetical protein